VPFARFVALHGVGNIKRYHIAKVGGWVEFDRLGGCAAQAALLCCLGGTPDLLREVPYTKPR
jgi:hypothetical protein